jgi:hypothetical protein
MTNHEHKDVEARLAEIEARRGAARKEVSALCQGRGRPGGHDWTMCVPVQQDDSDIVLVASLNDIPALLAVARAAAVAVEQSGNIGIWSQGLAELEEALAALGGGRR